MSDFLAEFPQLQQAFPKKALPPSRLSNCFSLTDFGAENLQEEDVITCYVTTAGYYHSDLNGNYVSLIELNREGTLPQNYLLCGIYIFVGSPNSKRILFQRELSRITNYLRERLKHNSASSLMSEVTMIANNRLALLGNDHTGRVTTVHWLGIEPRLLIARDTFVQPFVGEGPERVTQMSYAPNTLGTKITPSVTRVDTRSSRSEESLDGRTTIGCWKPLSTISGRWIVSMIFSANTSGSENEARQEY